MEGALQLRVKAAILGLLALLPAAAPAQEAEPARAANPERLETARLGVRDGGGQRIGGIGGR